MHTKNFIKPRFDRRFIRQPLGTRPSHRAAPRPEFRADLVVEGVLELELAGCGGRMLALCEIVEGNES
jgi:hypothetical protein